MEIDMDVEMAQGPVWERRLMPQRWATPCKCRCHVKRLKRLRARVVWGRQRRERRAERLRRLEKRKERDELRMSRRRQRPLPAICRVWNCGRERRKQINRPGMDAFEVRRKSRYERSRSVLSNLSARTRTTIDSIRSSPVLNHYGFPVSDDE